MGGTIDIIPGVILTILITIWIKYLRRPKLSFQKTSTSIDIAARFDDDEFCFV